MEFDIIGDATEAFADSVADGHFTPVDTGSLWSMSDVRLVGDVLSLDSALQNSYAEHVLSGKSLPINYGTYITMQQTVLVSECFTCRIKAKNHLLFFRRGC